MIGDFSKMATRILDYDDFETGETIYQVPTAVKTYQFETLGAAKNFISSKQYREIKKYTGFGERKLDLDATTRAETDEALAKRKIAGKKYLK